MNTLGEPAGIAAMSLMMAACGMSPITSGNELPDGTVVVCGTDGTRLEPAVIRPQGDGVHLRVQNPADEERMVLFYGHGSHVVPPGSTDLVTTAPPDSLRVACVAPGDAEEFDEPLDGEGPYWPYPTEEEWITLEIVDVEGLWTDDTLPCEVSTGTHGDYEWEMEGLPMPEGVTGDPVEMARDDLPGMVGDIGVVRPDDVVEPAGYPEVTGRVRLVRDGQTVAVIWYRPDGRGGWHLGGAEYCDDAERGGPEPAHDSEDTFEGEAASESG